MVPGGVPGPGGDVPGPGGCTWLGGGEGSVSSRSGGGVVFAPGPGGCQVLPVPPVNRMTDACKNITLSQFRCGR